MRVDGIKWIREMVGGFYRDEDSKGTVTKAWEGLNNTECYMMKLKN